LEVVALLPSIIRGAEQVGFLNFHLFFELSVFLLEFIQPVIGYIDTMAEIFDVVSGKNKFLLKFLSIFFRRLKPRGGI
jgi:hypothetical protein